MKSITSPIPNFSNFETEENYGAIKKYLEVEKKSLYNQFDPHHDVTDIITKNAELIDNAIIHCWHCFLAENATQLAIVAVGGYGRKEMFPHSDIDLLVLTQSQTPTSFQEQIEKLLRFLWDIGLKPSQSVRTVVDCINAARTEQTIMTGLLDARLIDGNRKLFDQLQAGISKDKIWPPEIFFEIKVEEQKKRYAKYHDTAYKLEPNVKEGPGGLRDIQVIEWVAKRDYSSAQFSELVEHNYLTENEYQDLMTGREYLWRVRFALHRLTDRCEDRLLFEYQRELASWFGFEKDQYNLAVEEFMQQYFKTVVQLERLNEMLLQLFSEEFIASENPKPKPLNSEFHLIQGYIEATQPDVFQKRPLALFDIFLLQQRKPSIKGVRASTIRLIRENIDLINDNFRKDDEAKRLFVEILKQPSGITHQLRRMNRYGILAAYLPAFGHIVARMQYDLFHIYTVDEHTLFVIRNMRRFAIKKFRSELPFCNQIFKSIDKPYILYIAGLFHDIAKGRNTDHSVLGAEFVRDFCIRHHFSIHDTNLAMWLVRHHLTMSVTAQRNDMSDPEVINEFALLVGDETRLNYLYLLTVADIRATNPDLWNEWKDALLKELYFKTFNTFRLGLQSPVAQSDKILETKEDAKNALTKLGLPVHVVNQAWKKINDDYFLNYSANKIAWHMISLSQNQNETLPLVFLQPQNRCGSLQIFIYADNANDLFYLSTAIIDQLGMTVLEAHILSLNKEHAFYSFQVLEQSGQSINTLTREIEIGKAIRQRLMEGNIKGTSLLGRQPRQAKYFPIATKINMHQDPNQRYSILELITTDRSGLLSKIGHALQKQNLHLHHAKISTIGARVEDLFFILNEESKPLSDLQKIDQLKQEIINTLEESQDDLAQTNSLRA